MDKNTLLVRPMGTPKETEQEIKRLVDKFPNIEIYIDDERKTIHLTVPENQFDELGEEIVHGGYNMLYSHSQIKCASALEEIKRNVISMKDNIEQILKSLEDIKLESEENKKVLSGDEILSKIDTTLDIIQTNLDNLWNIR